MRVRLPLACWHRWNLGRGRGRRDAHRNPDGASRARDRLPSVLVQGSRLVKYELPVHTTCARTVAISLFLYRRASDVATLANSNVATIVHAPWIPLGIPRCANSACRGRFTFQTDPQGPSGAGADTRTRGGACRMGFGICVSYCAAYTREAEFTYSWSDLH